PAHPPGPGAGPGYGYPQTPPPAYQAPSPVPQPYTLSPQPQTTAGSGHGTHGGGHGGHGGGGRPGGRRNVPVIVGSIAVAALAIAGLITALSMNNGSDDYTNADPGVSDSAAPAAGHRDPERNRTIDATKCSEASEDGLDPSKVTVPDLRYKDLLSVKDCLRAAGWTWSEPKKQNDGTQAEDIVIGQYPRPGAAVLPKEQEFELTISTGDPE
ncbi:PASTA domain-containing protein, partial [Streptomyces sp. NPDC056730]|uniref:Stk1 family PASTA domain-containing Ser/Thr kinase n=1 Tax=Streptomyces sp. NPDC056730 TaxID=3345929 RepID=UPI00368F9B52